MQLVPFPSIGYQIDSERWRIIVAGVVRLPYSSTIRKRMVLRILGNVMGVAEEEILSDRYFPRIRPFVSDGAKKCHIQIRIGEETSMLGGPTKRNGHFSEAIYVPSHLVEARSSLTECGRATLDVHLSCLGSNEWQTAKVFLMPRAGVSVITDIDDTIKDSAINDRKELLANTFLRPFRSISGMADVYNEWANNGVDFHYVSSSPWQLLKPISEMLERDGFPSGSVHLRYFRLRNHVLQRMIRIKRSGKITSLKQVVGDLRDRRFLLVGDSGEKDLELYCSLVKRYGDRILAVFIRNLASKPLSDERIRKFTEQYPQTPLHIFRDAEELRGQATPYLESQTVAD
ncbi:MAG: phosphatase domain-containing protein [Pirellulaceae bacterium]